MEKTIYYSIQNGGDGSAYPKFFEDMQCAELDQELMEEGWGEPCVGEISAQSNGEITFDNSVTTRAQFIKELKEELKDSWTSAAKKKEIKRVLELLK